MIFPLGLGHKLLKIPIITILLVVINIACYFYFKANHQMDELIDHAYIDSKYIDEMKIGFIDYCQKNSTNKKYCKQFVDERLKDIVAKKKTSSKTKSKKDQKETDASLTDILNTKNLFIKYRILIENSPEDLVTIKNYDRLMGAKSKLTELLEDISTKYDFLTKNNFNYTSLLKAQFNHYNLLHLIGNMVFLLIFGIYVEHRVNFGAFVFFYILGGSMGILAQAYGSDPNHFILGASANVYAVMGMFYALFYDKKMKFLIWYFIPKKITVNVKYWLPALIFANELVQTMGDGTGLGDGVAHYAHIGGLISGILCGLFLRELNPLHEHFLYEFEAHDWRIAQKSANPTLISDTAVRILEFNPYNDTVLENFMETLIEDYAKKPTAVGHVKISKLFPVFFKYCLNNNKFNELFKCLKTMQPYANIEPLLRNRNTADLILLGDTCVNREEYLLAITAYVAFVHSYPNSKLNVDIQKTIKNILDHLEYDEFSLEVLNTLASNSHNVFLKKLLFESHQQKTEASEIKAVS